MAASWYACLNNLGSPADARALPGLPWHNLRAMTSLDHRITMACATYLAMVIFWDRQGIYQFCMWIGLSESETRAPVDASARE